MDFNMFVYPRDISKEDRADYNNADIKLTINKNDIVRYVKESINKDIVLNIYLSKNNEFKFKLNNDMDSVFELDDFKEDWLQFRVNPKEYKWIMSVTEFIESDECYSLIKKIESNFINAGVDII